MKRPAPGALIILGSVLLGGVACSRKDSLVLLDLRSSGPLGAAVARVRLSASGWPTRTVTTETGTIGPDGFRVGYYGPGNGGAVSVTAEALDEGACVLGSGSATVAKLAAGAVSAPLTLFIRPLPANGCVDAGVDAGNDAAGDDGGGGDGGVPDAGDDGAGEAGTDAGDDAGGGDTAADAGDDVAADSAADAMDDVTDDGVTADAPIDS